MIGSGSTIEPTPGSRDAVGRAPVWSKWARVEQRGNRPLGNPGIAISAPERILLLRAAAQAGTALREAASAAADAAARARSVAQALDEALAALEAADGGQAPRRSSLNGSPRPTAVLSPREQEVLVLVAEGRSNKAIAAALFVSPNTVKTHVAALLTKLDAHTRVQLATMVARQTRA